MQKNLIAALLSIGLSHMPIVAEATELFEVGPDKPLKTISAALAAMREGDICVVGAGIYRECIDVRQSRVTLRGQGRVVVTGCDEAGAMRPCVVNNHRGMTKAVGLPVYDVFSGDHYMMQARHPNKTSSMTSNMDWEESVITSESTVNFINHDRKRFAGLNDGYYVGLHSGGEKLSSWYSLTLPITAIGEDGNIRVNAENASSGFMGKYGQGKGLGYMIGAKAVLDSPGEWYSDGTQVFLIPPTGGAGVYELRTRLYGAVVSGNGVRFENLRFKAAAVQVKGNDAFFKKCVFEYISPFRHNANDTPANKRGQSLASCWGIPENGTAGVFVKGDRFIAEDCRFAKSWWCGMMIRGNDARVENCLFEDMNWMAKRCAGLFSWGNSNVVRLCTFRNLGGAGVEGGNANWIGQYARNNVWENNYIEGVCKLIVDQGFFYVNHQSGSNPKADSIWRYNVGKGARSPVKGTWTQTSVGYYVDNSSSGYRIHNNIAIDANEALRYNDTKDGPEAGKDIWFYNNTFYTCGAIGFGCWNPKGNSKADAEIMLINNLAIPQGNLDFSKWGTRLKWRNNLQSLPASALKNPEAMNFTPTEETLKTGGIPVQDKQIPYIGAVDPAKGMWRYGADESELPEP